MTARDGRMVDGQWQLTAHGRAVAHLKSALAGLNTDAWPTDENQIKVIYIAAMRDAARAADAMADAACGNR